MSVIFLYDFDKRHIYAKLLEIDSKLEADISYQIFHCCTWSTRLDLLMEFDLEDFDFEITDSQKNTIFQTCFSRYHIALQHHSPQLIKGMQKRRMYFHRHTMFLLGLLAETEEMLCYLLEHGDEIYGEK